MLFLIYQVKTSNEDLQPIPDFLWLLSVQLFPHLPTKKSKVTNFRLVELKISTNCHSLALIARKKKFSYDSFSKSVQTWCLSKRKYKYIMHEYINSNLCMLNRNPLPTLGNDGGGLRSI